MYKSWTRRIKGFHDKGFLALVGRFSGVRFEKNNNFHKGEETFLTSSVGNFYRFHFAKHAEKQNENFNLIKSQ